ncbi:MAG TPA: CPBP family intramembrane glutamic endopeptidase, partial [Bacteroidia bacterium]
MSIQSTVQNFHPSGKFLMFIGMFLLGLALASIAQVIIILPFSDMKSINDLAKLEDFSNPNIIKAMKIAQAVSAILMFIIPSLVFAFLSSEKKISALKMNKGFHPMIGLAAIALVFVAMPVINWTGELNSHLALPDFMSGVEKWMKNSEDSLKKLTDAFLQMNGIGDLIVNVIVIALLAAVGEELLFRGTIQTIFIEWMKNKHVAIIVTSILFSALHAQFYGFLPRMLLGVVLGYLYLWSGSLWLSMLFHFLNNGIAVLFSYLIGKGKIDES